MLGARTATAAIGAVTLALLASATLGIDPVGAAPSGGVGVESSSDESRFDGRDRTSAKYDRLWNQVSRSDRRWARRTSECESGGDPDAIGGGGSYRGAFQFLKSTWRAAPKSPGGDPIDYPYRTQAVVAISLKRREGTDPWPVCG